MPCVALLSTTIDLKYLAPAFREACPGIDLRLGGELGKLDDIDAALCWFPPHGVLAQMPKLKLVQSLAAGVEHITADPELPRDLPLCRIVDPDLAGAMNAYVCWAVVQHQRGMAGYLRSAGAGLWQVQPVRPPSQHRVGIAGLGVLGLACAEALAAIGYAVRGWSRSAKSELPASVSGFHGPDQLADFLAGCDTLVCLLPLTAETEGILDARFFAGLPRGAHLINVGRGGHVVEADLLQALASGQLGFATLDAFVDEPLPAAHPFWVHPKILVTPHIASRTPLPAIARQTLRNLELIERGLPPENAVDPALGY